MCPDISYGSQIIGTFLQDRKFPFPKSIYAVFDTLKFFIGNKPDALLIDFFAGSGTTLHALNLLNTTDDGQRRCILVANNEVSGEEAESLRKRGLQPSDTEWEAQGICRSVTWPRSKFSILGKAQNGSEIEDEYFSAKIIRTEKSRRFQQIGFTSIKELTTTAKKKQLVALIDGIPQSEVKKDSAFIVSEKHPASILFDESQSGAWLKTLEDQWHITDFYVVTTSKDIFDDIKVRINDLLGPMIVTEEDKRPMKEGFPANLEYFRLDFLDKDQVALGRQFREILPLLWLRAGAIGPRPEMPKNKPISAMILPDHNPFAVLVDETHFAEFLTALEAKESVTHVFLVTDSEEAFQEMASQLSAPHVVQLYRDYLENFTINKGESA
jgi:adenine-specific DNA-methyltransferase